MSPKVRNIIIAVIILVLVISVAYYVKIAEISERSESSETALGTTFTTNFYFSISINYSGSWNLVYWGTNGTVSQYNYTNYNVKGNLNGSGYYDTTIVTYGVGYVENTLCANAIKLDSQNLTLTLTVLTTANSTVASNPSVEACGTYGV